MVVKGKFSVASCRLPVLFSLLFLPTGYWPLATALKAQSVPARFANIENIRYAGGFAGANAGAKIAACIADLPSTGGTCDARGLEGGTVSADVTIPANSTLLLGAGTYAGTGRWLVKSNSAMLGLGGVADAANNGSTVLSYTGSGSAISPETTTTLTRSVLVRDLTIVGSSSGAIGLDMLNARAWRVQNVLVRTFSAGTAVRIRGTVPGPHYNVLTDVQTSNCLTELLINSDVAGNAPNRNRFLSFIGYGGGTNGVSIANGATNEFYGLSLADSSGVELQVSDSDNHFYGASLENSAPGTSTGLKVDSTANRTMFYGTIGGYNTNVLDNGGNSTIFGGGVAKLSSLEATATLQFNTGNPVQFLSSVDSMNVKTAFPAPTNPSIYATSSGGGAYPFLEAGNLVIQARASGAFRDILLATGNGAAPRWIIDRGGPLLAGADNAYDIGAAGASRPKDYFGAGKVQAAKALISGLNTLAFSATPTFDASLGNTHKITLTGNVTSSTLSNATAGQNIDFIICQDGTGSRTFAWPTAPAGAVLGGMTIGVTAAKCSAQSFRVADQAAVTVQDTGDTVTLAAHPFSNGNVVQFSLTANGITAATNYWVCNKAANTFQLDTVSSACTSLLTITPDGTNYVTGVTVGVRTAYATSAGVTNQ